MNPYAIAGISAALFLAGAGAAYQVQDWRYSSVVSKMESAQAKDEATGAQMALDSITQATDTIKAAALDYAALQSTLGTKIDGLRKELKNAKPLAPECADLDSVRLRIAQDAVRAARDTAAGSKSGLTLPHP